MSNTMSTVEPVNLQDCKRPDWLKKAKVYFHETSRGWQWGFRPEYNDDGFGPFQTLIDAKADANNRAFEWYCIERFG